MLQNLKQESQQKFFLQVGKVDVEGKTVAYWHEPNGFPSTCTFVPRPGAQVSTVYKILIAIF